MVSYLIQRVIYIFITLIAVTVVSFILIQLPPGDYLDSYIMQLQQSQTEISRVEIETLQRHYGLDRPLFVQFFVWVKNIIIHADFGISFEWNRPVLSLIKERIWYTIAISYLSLIFVWIVSIPVAIYSATHQYSVLDYCFSFIGYIGLATPNFLLALVLMFLGFRFFGVSVGGLFSPEYIRASFSLAKFVDLLKHIWIPVVVLGTAGTAGNIRRLRAILLDELSKNYVITARAKGVKESVLIMKYPVRVSITPMVSGIGTLLTNIIGGGGVVAVVLSLPTLGPLHLRSILTQDMYLAGSLLLFSCFLSLIGTLISDILLVIVDPRIRFGKTR